MCGIIGVHSLTQTPGNLGMEAIRLLKGNKNRGQDGYGLTLLTQDGKLQTFKFQDFNTSIIETISDLNNQIISIIGHARYPTSGGSGKGDEYIQPFEAHYLGKGVSFAFNGNIINAEEISEELTQRGYHLKHSPLLDTEVLKCMILEQIEGGNTNLIDISKMIHNQIDGSCNMIMLSKDADLTLSKDRWGFRPVAWAVKNDTLYISSESAALFKVGCQNIQFLSSGNNLIAEKGKQPISQVMNLEKGIDKKRCFFEAVYFADEKTRLRGEPSSTHRYRLGQILAQDDVNLFTKDDTVIIDIPSSSEHSAKGYADVLDINRIPAITKNPDSTRTFIETQQTRAEKIRVKYIFNPNLKSFIKGKKVILMDDSIVRGGTIKGVVETLRRYYEPSEIHLRIPSPPIVAPCFYGINMASINELEAPKFFHDINHPTDDELKKLASSFGVESIRYISKSGLVEALRTDTKDICMGCISGNYPTEGGQERYQSLVDSKD